MPEGLEVEIYRRRAATAVGRQAAAVTIDASQPQADEIIGELTGSTLIAVDRVGKHLILDFQATEPQHAAPVRLGIHFGMAGRLIVDDRPAIEELVYASNRLDPSWDRLVIEFTERSGGGSLSVNDPRRWSRFVLEPADLPGGIDLLSVTASDLAPRIATSSAAIKALLLQQDVIAGLGNMLVDEVLSAAAIDPRRPAKQLGPGEVDAIAAAIGERLPAMLAAGGSHSGLLDPEHRSARSACPRCGGRLERGAVAGRTTIWCVDHQR